MKKIRILAFLLLALMPLGLCACSNDSAVSNSKNEINIAALKGPTGLGLLKLMEDSSASNAKTNNNITLYNDPSEVMAKIYNKDVDIAALPTNMAANLYQKSNHNIKMLSVNALGSLAIVSKGEVIDSISDLKGKTIYMAGQGSTAEYTLKYILETNNLSENDVSIEYKSEHTEIASLLLSDQISVALLPEPFVTQVTMKDSSINKSLDLNYEWGKNSHQKDSLTMGCLVATNEFIENNKNTINNFLEDYKCSTEFVNSNIEESAKLSEKYGIMRYDAAKNAIPNCKIVYIDSLDMANRSSEFFNVMYDYNPKSVGGTLPDEGFYYKK